MAGITRRTYKQELIEAIDAMFKRSTLRPIPESCLTDMSTSSLATFQNWLHPIIIEHYSKTPAHHQLPPKGKK